MQFAEQFLLKEMQDGSLLPNLASSYDANNDPANPSVTLHLVKGVKYQDGTDFNAQAVKWNLDKEMTPGSTNIGSTTAWKSIEVLDDYTVRINLKSWQNTLVRTFSDALSFTVSPTAYQKNGADWANYNMVGTGPFIQKEFQRDVTLAFTRNPNYWEQGKPYLDGVQLLYVTDTMTQEVLFKSGGGDVLQCASDLMASRMQAAGFKIIAQPATGATLVPDSANPDSPWSKPKVRQAAEYAIDKESIVKTFGYGFQQAAYQYAYSTSPAYDPGLVSQYRTYNPAKAKQLLAEAGYPNGFKTSIIVSPLGASSEIAIALQAYLAAVGIQCELQYPQAGAFAQIQTGTWRNGIIYGPFLQYANANTAFRTLVPGSAWFQSLKRPDGFGDLYNASLSTAKIDPSLVQKLEDAMFNDCTEIFLSFGSQELAVTNKVQDAGLGTRGNWGWFEPQDTWLTK
jgi:ABC-type transport system substrate-binding protein